MSALVRTLCRSRITLRLNLQVGSVIGKAGQIVKNIREETNSKIRVCEGTLQCEDRVIVIAARDDEADAEENNAQVSINPSSGYPAHLPE